MADRKPTTLEDLDRDELLQLLRRRHFWIRERDMVWAQWEVACARASALRDQALAMYDEIKQLRTVQQDAAQALSQASTEDSKRWLRLSAAFRRADAALREAEVRQDKVFAKADRFQRREERLYQLHQELPV